MGDSDLFSLELPGSLASKKSTEDMENVPSTGDLDGLDLYGTSRRGSLLDDIDRDMSLNDDTSRLSQDSSRRRKNSNPRGYIRSAIEYTTIEPDYTSNEEDGTGERGHQARRGLSSLGEAASFSNASLEYLEDRSLVADFLRGYHCISMMPQSSKVVVLDSRISLRAAFQALEENDIESAPVWDSLEHDYTGIITIGDLLSELLDCYQSDPDSPPDTTLKKLDKRTIKQMAVEKDHADLISVEPSDSLYEACSIISRFKVHRVPVIDRVEHNTILFILTASRIVVFLMKIMTKRPALFEVPIDALQIGRFSNITTSQPNLPLHEIVQLIERKHFAAIPIVDENGVLVDTLYKSDLARIPPSDLLSMFKKPIVEVLKVLREKKILRSSGPNTCTIDETLEAVLARMMDWKLRSLVIIDPHTRIAKGIISLGDILRLFVV